MTVTDQFPRETKGLASGVPTSLHRLRDGDRFAFEIAPIVKRIGGADVRMLAYNGSVPGPTLHVDQGSEVTVEVTNNGDVETTVHWHGIRLDNQYDGVPVDTQAPIEIGQSFTYRVRFPDPGFYWYHPHLREDFGQEMGMYGTIIVEPTDPTYWARVDRQFAIALDDILIENGQVAAFERSGPTFTAMGRFGNVLLANGEEQLVADVALGDVVRLHLVNTANTRIFNVAVAGARMKLVGGDSGRYEHEAFVEAVRLAPSERAIVDVFFDAAGEAVLEHRTPDRTYELGRFAVKSKDGSFEVLRVDPELSNLAQYLTCDRERAPEKTLAFRSTMPLLYGSTDDSAAGYACPMHPEVTSTEPGRCPKCGMKLVPSNASKGAERPTDEADAGADDNVPLGAGQGSYACPIHPEVTGSGPTACPKCGMWLTQIGAAEPSAPDEKATYACPMHPEVTGSGATACPKCGMWLTPIEPDLADVPAADPLSHRASETTGRHPVEHLDGDGLEWEDLMPEINRQANPSNMRWCVTDLATGAENGDIFWTFRVGDWVKIRLVNELGSDHPMHHPFHIHGAGRFLILSRDGEPEPNLVWKDTVLVPAGQTVDILLEVTNPGRWMAHCHIAEHIESGMMFSFDVLPEAAA